MASFSREVNCPIRLFAGVVESGDGDMHIPHPDKKIIGWMYYKVFSWKRKNIKSGENLLDRVQVEPQLNRCDICHYLWQSCAAWYRHSVIIMGRGSEQLGSHQNLHPDTGAGTRVELQMMVIRRFPKISQSRRRPLLTKAFSWLIVPTRAFTFKTLFSPWLWNLREPSDNLRLKL